MRIREQHSALGEPVHVRRLHVGVPTEAANPIIEIIDRNEDDVGPALGGVQGLSEDSGAQERDANT